MAYCGTLEITVIFLQLVNKLGTGGSSPLVLVSKESWCEEPGVCCTCVILESGRPRQAGGEFKTTCGHLKSLRPVQIETNAQMCCPKHSNKPASNHNCWLHLGAWDRKIMTSGLAWATWWLRFYFQTMDLPLDSTVYLVKINTEILKKVITIIYSKFNFYCFFFKMESYSVPTVDRNLFCSLGWPWATGITCMSHYILFKVYELKPYFLGNEGKNKLQSLA